MGGDVSDILRDVAVASWVGPTRGEVSSVVNDSRKCLPGSLFLAIRGDRHDGYDFIPAAVAAGARFIVCSGNCPPLSEGIGVISVADVAKAQAIIARNFYGDPSASLLLLGVSGTNGKTTVTYLLEAIMQAAGMEVGVIGTIEYRYGQRTLPAPNTTPDALTLHEVLSAMLKASVRCVVMEVSSHAIALGRVSSCHFDFGVFTNLSQDHLDFHHDMDSYYRTKREFFVEMIDERSLPHVAINMDDAHGRLLAKAKRAEEVVGYGLNDTAQVTARNVVLSLSGIKADIACRGGAVFPLTSPLLGEHNLMNILAAVSAAVALGVSPNDIQRGVANLRGVPGRLERVIGPAAGPAVFVDYAHTPDGLERVIAHLSRFKKGRLLTVFGCGGNRDRTKRGPMGGIATAKSDITVITSDNPRDEEPQAIIADILAGVAAAHPCATSASELNTGSYMVIPERREAITTAIAIAGPEDIVLLAGKGHETYQEIGGVRTFFDDRVTAREALVATAGGA